MQPRYQPRESSTPLPRPDFCAVVPAYNAGPALHKTVDEIFSLATARNIAVEVVVVNDGSTDASTDGLTPRAGLVILDGPNQGKGAALRAGLSHSTAPVRGFVDADGNYPPAALFDLFTLLTYLDVDCAIGMRLGGHETIFRRVASKAFSTWVFLWHGLSFDTQAGCKAFRGELLDDVLPHLRANGFAFDVDILSQVRTRHWRPPVLLPLIFDHDDATSTVTLRRTLRALADVARLRPRRARAGWNREAQ